MKITRGYLRRLIKEELSHLIEDKHEPQILRPGDPNLPQRSGKTTTHAFDPRLVADKNNKRLTISPVTSFYVYNAPDAANVIDATDGVVDVYKYQGNFCESAYRVMSTKRSVMGFSPDGKEVVFGVVDDYGFPNSSKNKVSEVPFVTLSHTSSPMFVSQLGDRLRNIYIKGPDQPGGCGYGKIGQPDN